MLLCLASCGGGGTASEVADGGVSFIDEGVSVIGGGAVHVDGGVAHVDGDAQARGIVPRNGLSAEYLFEGNANDTSANGHDGLVHGATLSADRSGRPSAAYTFAGANGHSITTSFVPSNTFSVSLWYYANAAQLPNPALFSTFSTGQFNGIYYAQYGTSHETIWSDGNAWHAVTASPETWVHLVVVSANSTITIYKDGAVATKYPGTTTHADSLVLGDSRFNGRYFTGVIDDFRVYDRALSSLEVDRCVLQLRLNFGRRTTVG